MRAMIKAVLFDFGGVVAEEAFREGLEAIARKNGLDPHQFFIMAREFVYRTGYVTGIADESDYWKALREKTGITGTDKEFREEILKRFTLRQEMLSVVESLKSSGFTVGILSDQTNWLEEINQRHPFFHHFDHVFNSFHLNKSKRDSVVFKEVCSKLGLKPEEVLFVDDGSENVERASRQGLKTIHFRNADAFRKVIQKFISPISA